MYIIESRYKNDLYNQIKINIFKLKEKLNVLYKICFSFHNLYYIYFIYIIYNLI